jgi:hypothetical protein
MVRASLGIYSTAEDIAVLGDAVEQLVRDRDRVATRYQSDREGTWRRSDGGCSATTFSITDAVRTWAS